MLRKIDIPLFIISLLLAATLFSYATGIFPYPFGFIVLCVLFIGRYLHISTRAGREQRPPHGLE